MDGDPYSLYVTWDPPTTPNGYITSYNVYCQDSQTMVGSGGGPVMSLLPIPSTFTTSTADGDTLNATVTGLTPFSSYGCYVSANTSIGEGDSSDPVFQTTDEFGKKYRAGLVEVNGALECEQPEIRTPYVIRTHWLVTL